jgi:hypothetical protein
VVCASCGAGEHASGGRLHPSLQRRPADAGADTASSDAYAGSYAYSHAHTHTEGGSCSHRKAGSSVRSTPRSSGAVGTSDAGKLARTCATVVGAVFLLVGVLGFIPGITTHYSDLTFAGHMSGAKLLGVFEVSVLHNVVHLLFGLAGLALARRASTAVNYLVGGGVLYLVLWVYGLVIDKQSAANFVPLNTPDDWLHFVLGVGMIGLGLVGRRAAMRSAGSGPSYG